MELGEARKEAGIARVISRNQSYVAEFHRAADEMLAEEGIVTSLGVIGRIGMPSGSPNAVGAAMRAYATNRELKVLRYIKSERASCHAAIIAVWGKP